MEGPVVDEVTKSTYLVLAPGAPEPALVLQEPLLALQGPWLEQLELP